MPRNPAYKLFFPFKSPCQLSGDDSAASLGGTCAPTWVIQVTEAVASAIVPKFPCVFGPKITPMTPTQSQDTSPEAIGFLEFTPLPQGTER